MDTTVKNHPASMSEDVYLQLIAALEQGTWGVDERLPSETELAQRYAVSRPVLRQALGRLRAEGRIHSRKGSGHFVRDIAPIEAFGFGALRNLPDVRQFLEFRCVLESELASQAARQQIPEAVEEIVRRHREFADAIKTGKVAIDEDIAFHLSIARATGNRFFLTTYSAAIQPIQFSIRTLRELNDQPVAERFETIYREHDAVVKAIVAADPEGAREAMRAHLQRVIQRLFGA